MKLHYYSVPLYLLILFYLSSCSNGKEKESIDNEVIDLSASLNTNFDAKIFSIPSPVQTAMLIKDLHLPFDQYILNPTSNTSNYSTEFKQALNLGVYGTDLGYCTLYEQKNQSLKCLSAIEKLTRQIGLEGTFDKTFITRFEKNSDRQDSMIIISANAYRKVDYFLKNAKRKSTSSLILAGGWIESIYIACKMNATRKNDLLKQRIGEQQQTLYTMIEILVEYNKSSQNNELITSLKDLKRDFDKIIINYSYVAPKTDAKNKITTLQHNTNVNLPEEIMTSITKKVNLIRESVTK